MNNRPRELYFLIGSITITLVLSFFILKSFLYPIILALIFVAAFDPMHRKILRFTNNKENLASLFSTTLIIIFFLTPILLLSVQITKEAQQFYVSIIENENNIGAAGAINNIRGGIANIFPFIGDSTINVEQYVKQGLNWMVNHIGSIFSNAAQFALSLFIFLISLFYFFKDGEKLKQLAIKLSPLDNTEDETILKKLSGAINSVIKGNFLIALTQGFLTAIGFLIFGVPNPILWGSIAAIAALIPSVGTALVIFPAVLFLFFAGESASALGLFVWGVAAVGLIDNILGPKLIGRGMQLHPLVILLSVLGGISFFGPIGLILGPITVSLLFALSEIYSQQTKK